jgi:hypothetical protein
MLSKCMDLEDCFFKGLETICNKSNLAGSACFRMHFHCIEVVELCYQNATHGQ